MFLGLLGYFGLISPLIQSAQLEASGWALLFCTVAAGVSPALRTITPSLIATLKLVFALAWFECEQG